MPHKFPDQQTAGVGVDANIDARVFTHDGRTHIIEELKDIRKNTKTASERKLIELYNTRNR